MIVIQERLKDDFAQFGWSRIPDIPHTHAEEAAKHNHSYLEFLDQLLQEELVARHERFIRMKTRMARLSYHKTLEAIKRRYTISRRPMIWCKRCSRRNTAIPLPSG